MEAINNFLTSTGFYLFTQGDNWKCLIMIAISCVLLFLGIKKKFEPLLLVPIAIGMLVTTCPTPVCTTRSSLPAVMSTGICSRAAL